MALLQDLALLLNHALSPTLVQRAEMTAAAYAAAAAQMAQRAREEEQEEAEVSMVLGWRCFA